eukprot:jgi/Chrzof1/15267/UNPLg00664.t1
MRITIDITCAHQHQHRLKQHLHAKFSLAEWIASYVDAPAYWYWHGFMLNPEWIIQTYLKYRVCLCIQLQIMP